MSSILIKSMKMPETCDYCPLSHYYPNTMRVWCNAEEKLLIEDYDPMQADRKITKPKWCPLEVVEDANEEIDRIKYLVCCPMCDNERCIRGTENCEAEIWAKARMEADK